MPQHAFHRRQAEPPRPRRPRSRTCASRDCSNVISPSEVARGKRYCCPKHRARYRPVRRPSTCSRAGCTSSVVRTSPTGRYPTTCLEHRPTKNHIRTELIRRAKDRPCKDCGQRYPTAIMDLHHRDPAAKTFHITSGSSTRGFNELTIEIAKCDVLCPTCHRLRHHTPPQEP